MPEVLQEKHVYFKPVFQRETPRPFNEIWDLLRGELSDSGNLEDKLPPAREALAKLTVPLTKAYFTKTEFDMALFQLLRDCLSTYELTQSDNDLILLNLAETNEYAVGIARQKSLAHKFEQESLHKEHTLQSLPSTVNSVQSHSTSIDEMDVDATSDHAVCLLQNGTNVWSVTDCFSVVGLTMSDSACEDFGSGGTFEEPDFWDRHIGQVILDNLGSVLLFRAKRGVLQDSIPLTMIAGEKKGGLDLDPTENKMLRWVSARLQVPKACGDGFSYTIQDYGQFSDCDHDGSIEQALSVYVETNWYGLVAAIDVQKKLAAGKAPIAVPASGQSLMIGDVALDLQLCASPIRGAVTCQDHDQVNSLWTVSQGELFRGRLDINKVVQNSGAFFVDFCHGRNKKMGSSDVLIKVSSPTIHHLLVPSSEAWVALEKISRTGKPLVDEIGSVLHAIVETGPGFATIMDDLTMQGYSPLKPIERCGQLAVLWQGFQYLAENVLLPMAELGIVHADIRPGYDVTSSILFKLQRGKGGIEMATMKLIDLESLANYNRWAAGYHLDGRYYIRKAPEWDATTFVWWQCLAVAYSWKEALSTDSLRTSGALAQMVRSLRFDLRKPTEELPAWLDKFRDCAKGKVTAQTVKMMLIELCDEFSL